ncbi:MAG: DNA methyltransferase, partial [Chloroflexota bacterium]
MKNAAPDMIYKLVETFEQNLEAYRSSKNETELRREFLDKFFAALGWDVANEKGYDELSKEVVHEFSVEVAGQQKKADYAFRVGRGDRFDFLVEAKKPSVKIEASQEAAFQIRRYGWSAKIPINILTDFEHFAVYDCRAKPSINDKASVGRILLIHYKEYAERWDEIASLFSPEAIRKGSLAKFAEGTKGKKGTADVDDAFLQEIERWRELLAKNIALRNPQIDLDGLNYAVQMTIDRIVFLRICEERGIEPENQLRDIALTPHPSPAGRGEGGEGVYAQFCELFQRADTKYNSGLFHFKSEKGESSRPDDLTLHLKIDDKVLRDIISNLYYPQSPYAFLYIPADILGQVYERFLGKVIRLTAGHQAKVEEKPEVRKAGGVYYTPTYIVDYIVKNTVGKLLEGDLTPNPSPKGRGGLTPADVAKLKIVDPACGSGTFLLGAYQFLLDWHLNWYVNNDPEKWVKQKALTPSVPAFGRTPPPNSQNLGEAGRGSYRLTIAKKKEILLNNIFGVDIDPQAVEVTKLSLLLKALEGVSGQLDLGMERVLPDLGNNIKCGNSLIGWDYFEGQLMP